MDEDVREPKQHKRWTLVNKDGEVEGSDSDTSSSLEVLDVADIQGFDGGVCTDEADIQGTSVDEAVIQGACLDDDGIQGACLDDDGIQGACLDDADIHAASLDDADLEPCDVGAALEEAGLQAGDAGAGPDDLLHGEEQPASTASTPVEFTLHQWDNSWFWDDPCFPDETEDVQPDSTDSTEQISVSYQRQSSSEDFEKIQGEEEGIEVLDEVVDQQVAPSIEEVEHQEECGLVEPPAEETQNHTDGTGSDEEFVQVPEPEPVETEGPSTSSGMGHNVPHSVAFLHLQRRKRNSGSTDSSDSDFVRLEPSMAEDVPPSPRMNMMNVSTSSNSSSVSQGFFFFRRGYRREDGVAADDSDDMSSASDCLGDIPLSAENVPRSYRHRPNSSLSTTLTKISLLVLFTGIGIGIGHFIGTSWDIPDNQMEIDILNNRLDACDKSAKLLDYQLKESQRDLEALLLERQRLVLETGEVDAMKDKRIKLLMEESQELKKDKEKLNQELVSLRDSLTELEEKNQALTTSRDDYHEQWEEELEKNRALQEEIRSVGQVLEQQQEQTIILQTILDELNKDIAELRNQTGNPEASQTSPYDEQMNKLNEQVEKLQQERDELRQELEQAQQTYNAKLEKMTTQQEEAQQVSHTQKDKIEELWTEIYRLYKEKQFSGVEGLQRKIHLLATENTELREEVGRTRYATNSAAKLEKMTTRQEEAQQVSHTEQEKWSGVEELRMENYKLYKEKQFKDHALGKAQELQQKVNLLANENAELHEEVGRTRYATNSAEKSAEDLAFMKRQMTTLKHKYDRLRASRAALQTVHKEEGEVCEDTNAGCEAWAKHGECDKNPSYMHQYCRRSCRVCQRDTADPPSMPGQEADKTEDKMNILKDKVTSLQQENKLMQADIEALRESVLKSEKSKQASDVNIQELKNLLDTMEQQLSLEKNRAGLFEKLYIALQNQQSKSQRQTFNASFFNCVNALVSSVKVNMSEVIRSANFTFLNDADRYIKDYKSVVQNLTKDTQFAKFMENVWDQLKSKVGSEKLREYFDKVQTSYDNLHKTVKENWDAYSSGTESNAGDSKDQSHSAEDVDGGETSVPEMIGNTLHKTLSKVQEFSNQVVNDHQEALRSIRTSLQQLKDHIQDKWTEQPEEQEAGETQDVHHADEPVKTNGFGKSFGKERRDRQRHRRHHRQHNHHQRQEGRHYHGNEHRQSHHGNQHHQMSPPPSPRDISKYYQTYTEEYDPHLQKWVYSYTAGAPYDHIDADNWQRYADLQEESPVHDQKVDRVHRDTQSEPTTVHEEPEFQGFDPNELLHDSFSEGNDRKWKKYKKNFKKILGRLQKFNEESLVTLDEDDFEDIYEDLDDFIDDLDDVEVSDKLKTWLTCQERWWKGRLHRKHRDQDLVKGCGSHLMRWQLTVICKESCRQGRCDPSCPSDRQNSQAMCSGDKLCQSDKNRGANKDRSGANHNLHKDTSSHYRGKSTFNTTSPNQASWYFRRAQDRDNHLVDGKWYFRRTSNGHYHYRYVRTRLHNNPDWYFDRANEREYHHHRTDWVFNRAAEREFHRETPDNWYFRRHGDHQHRKN